MRYFSTDGKRDEIAEWCESNCEGAWEVAVSSRTSQFDYLMIQLESDDDAILYELRWRSKEVHLTHFGEDDIAEPAMSFEELEAEPDIVPAKTYMVGVDYWDRQREEAGREFADQVTKWCEENLSDKILIKNYPMHSIIGVPDENDRVLFMMKWEGQPMINASRWQWSGEDD